MLRHSLIALAILVLLPAASSAGAFTYYGPHMGFQQGPDQTVLGGQLQFNGVAPRVAFVPGIDFGFGQELSLISMNGDFHYGIVTGGTWQPYVGGGVSLNMFRETDRHGTVSHTEPGGQFIVGAAVRNQAGGRFFTEFKFGFGDSPDIKMLAGFNLRTH
jgi:hypothetical protein